MISFILKTLLILMLAILGSYILYLFLKSKAEEEINTKLKTANKELNDKDLILQRQIADFELQRKNFEIQKREAHTEIQQKQERVRNYYQQAVFVADEAKQIREEANKKVAIIEQRYSKLQQELYCARQRSKKLEKQIKLVL